MYQTTTTWITGKKIQFRTGSSGKEWWMSADNGDCSGDASFHFDADGLRRFIFALEKLEREMKDKVKKEEVRVK